MSREVEEDRFGNAFLLRPFRFADRLCDGVSRFRSRDDTFRTGEENACGQSFRLRHGLGFDDLVFQQLAHDRTGSVIAQATCVDVRRNEVMAEREHRNQRCQAALVPKIILEFAVAELRAACRLCSDESCLFPIEEIVSHKRK